MAPFFMAEANGYLLFFGKFSFATAESTAITHDTPIYKTKKDLYCWSYGGR